MNNYFYGSKKESCKKDSKESCKEGSKESCKKESCKKDYKESSKKEIIFLQKTLSSVWWRGFFCWFLYDMMSMGMPIPSC